MEAVAAVKGVWAGLVPTLLQAVHAAPLAVVVENAAAV